MGHRFLDLHLELDAAHNLNQVTVLQRYDLMFFERLTVDPCAVEAHEVSDGELFPVRASEDATVPTRNVWSADVHIATIVPTHCYGFFNMSKLESAPHESQHGVFLCVDAFS